MRERGSELPNGSHGCPRDQLMPVIDLLFYIIAFVVAIGILVAVHEFGHYYVAKRLGVKVLRFSIGFGTVIWSRTLGRDQTEYAISAIPLGGYVKMLDEREGPIPEADRERAFNRKPVGHRIAIVAAGPAANFVLAVIALTLMFMIGTEGNKAIIAEPQSETPAAVAGLQEGDRIVAVNERQTASWTSARLALIQEGLDHDRIEVLVESESGARSSHVLELGDIALLKGQDDPLGRLGLSVWRPGLPPVIREVRPGGAAEAAGLQAGDVIVTADGHEIGGETIANAQAWIDYVRARPNTAITLEVRRDGALRTLELIPGARTENGERYGFIGAGIGVDVPPELAERLRVIERHGPLTALVRGAAQTWDTSVLTLGVLWRLVVGQASLDNISGPITIAQYAGETAAIGLDRFLWFLAVISISLGIVNLLPIPILDGGHLLFYLIELVKGSPVSERTEAVGQRIGLMLLLGLMTLAFYNDITRLFG